MIKIIIPFILAVGWLFTMSYVIHEVNFGLVAWMKPPLIIIGTMIVAWLAGLSFFNILTYSKNKEEKD